MLLGTLRDEPISLHKVMYKPVEWWSISCLRRAKRRLSTQSVMGLGLDGLMGNLREDFIMKCK